MPQTIEELAERLATLTQPGARGRLVARGLARGMIWKNGAVPEGTPAFSSNLTDDLLDYGYSVLEQSLRLKDASGSRSVVDNALRVAAESIEAAVRKGAANSDRGFHLTVAAAGFHIAGYGARAYCLAPPLGEESNLSTAERLLTHLMRRSLKPLRIEAVRWLVDSAHQDTLLAQRLREPDDPIMVADVEVVALTGNLVRAVANFLAALENGNSDVLRHCTERLERGQEGAGARRFISLWWAYALASHLIADLWFSSFHAVLPSTIDGPDSEAWGKLRQRFIAVLRARPAAEIDLWPSQVGAARRAVDPTDDLVVALPTSAGKTRIAELCILRCLAQGKRVVYVTPLRALSAQLEFGLSRLFRPLGYAVTSLYGASGVAVADITTLKSANVVVATPEKLDFAVRLDPSVIDDVGLIVLDEGHMIGVNPREIRYEVLVQRLLQRDDADARRIVCLSAIFSEGDAFDDFTAWIRSDEPGAAIVSPWRPTRQRAAVLTWRDGAGHLAFEVDGERPFVKNFVASESPISPRRTPFPANDEEFTLAAAKSFVRDGQRVLIYCPMRKSVSSLGKAILKLHRQGHFPSMLPETTDLTRALHIGREWLGPDHVALRILPLGVGLHHAALPRAFLAEIEDLLANKRLPLVVASPTLAQGLDLSCSVLILRSLYRSRGTISPNEFANVRGRAGRAFVDLDGITVYPIFEGGAARRRKERVYRELNVAAQTREMESGLVLLVETLIELLAHRLGTSHMELRERLLNDAFSWSGQEEVVSPVPVSEDAEIDIDGADSERLLLELLANLDIAILGSVPDLSCSVDDLATALDAALRRSLWSRRLARGAPDDASLARTVVVARSRWLWSRTQASQRVGYYYAGVGHATGQFLDANLDILVEHLMAFESAVGMPDVSIARDAIVAFALLASSIAPFEFEFRPDNWTDVLTKWFSGETLHDIAQPDGIEVAFIQNDVVFRLVWAAEAVRVHAGVRQVRHADELTGRTALILTYGLPSLTAALLAQAGLPSRRVIMKVLAQAPAIVDDPEAIPQWLRAIDLPQDFWAANPIDGEVWNEFVARWTDRGRLTWTDWEDVFDVVWEEGRSVPAGEQVTIVPDRDNEVVWLCTLDGQPRGRVAVPVSAIAEATVLHSSVQDDGRVSAEFFGIRATPN
ncbi:MAG: DEAD/DEAH box helicase [Pirellulales bacterium]